MKIAQNARKYLWKRPLSGMEFLKYRVGIANSDPGNQKSEDGNVKFHPGSDESENGNVNSHPGIEKSVHGTDASEDGF